RRQLYSEFPDLIGRVRHRVRIGLTLGPQQVFLPNRSPGPILYIDAKRLGKLLQKLRIQYPHRHANLLAKLINRPDARQSDASLAELLAAGEVSKLLDPVGIEDRLAGV